MKTVKIGWRQRLAELYSIAEATGADSESCYTEWWDNTRATHGRHVDIEVEYMPLREEVKFKDFCDSDDE